MIFSKGPIFIAAEQSGKIILRIKMVISLMTRKHNQKNIFAEDHSACLTSDTCRAAGAGEIKTGPVTTISPPSRRLH